VIARADIIAAVAAELDSRAGRCLEAHGEIGAGVADRLGLEPSRPTSKAPAPDALELGLWIDDSPGLALLRPYLERLRALPLSHVAVMVDSTETGLDARWTARQLADLAHAVPEMGVVLTLWPEPTAAYVRQLERELPALIAAGVVRTVELDLEGGWKLGKLSGYASMRAAGQALVEAVRRSGAREHEVTTFPAHAEAHERGAVQDEARLWLQTYPVAHARGERRDFDGPLGPERRPFEDVVRVRKTAEPGVEVCAGLAAWAQDGWPGEPGDAMAMALGSAVRAGVRRVRWWSSKHVIGARANGYAAAAIEAARALSIRGTK
jgi:hypothetical protein